MVIDPEVGWYNLEVRLITGDLPDPECLTDQSNEAARRNIETHAVE